MRPYEPALFRYVRQIIPGEWKSEIVIGDVLQDVRLEMLRQAHEPAFNRRYAFLAWARAIAHGRTVDLVRAAAALKHGGPPDAPGHQQRHALALADELARLASPRRTPPDEAIYRETLRTVRAAVGRLAPRARRIVSLRYARDLEIEQIAQRLHTTPNQVKYVLTQAKGELRDRLGSFMAGVPTLTTR